MAILTARERYTAEAQRIEKKKKKELHERMREDAKERKERIKRFTDAAKQSMDPNNKGSLGLASHLAGISPEGVAAAIMLDLFLSLMQFIVNTPYLEKWSDYNDALKVERELQETQIKQLRAKEQGLLAELEHLEAHPKPTAAYREELKACRENLEKCRSTELCRLVYQEYETNEIDAVTGMKKKKFPPLYPMIEVKNEKGKMVQELDLDNPYTPNQLMQKSTAEKNAIIEENGYVRQHTWLECYSTVYALHLDRMVGSSGLTEAQKKLIYNTSEAASDNHKKKDAASDRAAQMLGARQAPPKPAAPGH